MNRYPVLYVDDWVPDDQEPIGSKAKEWLRDAADQRWLFKEVRGQEGDRSPEGEDWAEKVVSHLAHELGIPAAQVELASRRGRRGVVSLSVLQGHELSLVHGDELLAEADPSYDRSQRGPAQGMTIPTVRTVLSDVGCAPGSPEPLHPAGGWGSMVSYLLLDAFVANTDRHHENWAVMRAPDATSVMAPSFDHASSLGFNEPSERCTARLTTTDRGFSVRAYVERGRGKFEGRPGLVDLALDALSTLDTLSRDDLKGRFVALSSDLCADILGRVPSELMSQASRTFALEILRLNQERLIHGFDRD